MKNTHFKNSNFKKDDFICYDAGCNIWNIERFNNSIELHKNEFQATYAECLKEKAFNEKRAYQFNNNIEVSI